ncbi:MAG: antitoxin MazE family protein [Candidatus Sulfotelmatobacter sp.]
MPAKNRPRSSRDKVRAHRKRLRQLGLRPIQIWVPDMRSPAFASEARRQSLAVAHSSHADDDQAFIDAIATQGEEA